MKSLDHSVYAMLIAGLAGLLTAGCGAPRLGEVTGRVTVDGVPAQGLQVSFDPQDSSSGPGSLAFTQADGTYRMFFQDGQMGALIGKHTVRVTAAEGGEAQHRITIPAEYNSESKLTYEVKAGDNTFDIDIVTNN